MGKLIAKSSKGRREAGGKTNDLPSHLRDVLAQCSGQFVAEDLVAAQPPRQRDAFAGALIELIDGGYLRAVADIDDADLEGDVQAIEAETADHLRADIASRRELRDDETAESLRQADELARRKAEEAREREAAAALAREAAAERTRRETEERERIEAEERALAAAEEAEREAIRQNLAQRRQRQQGIIKRVIGVVIAIASVIVILQAMPYSGTRDAYAKLASDMLGTPVSIQRARLALVGTPSWEFQDITIGTGDAAVHIGKATAQSTLLGVFSAPQSIAGLVLSDVRAPLETVLAGLRDSGTALRFADGNVLAHNVQLASSQLAVPTLDVELAIDNGHLSRLVANSVAGAEAQVTLKGERAADRWAFELLSPHWLLPLGAGFPVTDLVAKLQWAGSRLEVTEFVCRVANGVTQGNLTIDWSSAWHANGKVMVNRLDAAHLAPGWFKSAFASGEATIEAVAGNAAELFKDPVLRGRFDTGIGTLAGVDFGQVLERKGIGEQSRFDAITGTFVAEGGRVVISDVELSQGSLHVTGDMTLNADQTVFGRLRTEVRTASTRLGARLGVGGTREAPKYMP